MPISVSSAGQSAAIIAGLQEQFGSIDYSQFQAVPQNFYSYQTYPLAGVSQLNFFGSTIGQNGVTLADTNMPKPGSIGQGHFLLKSIGVSIKQTTYNPLGFAGSNTNTRTIASDLLMGFAQAGVLVFNIGARPFLTCPKPFLYLPPLGAQPTQEFAGVNSMAAAGGPPVVTSAMTSAAPYVAQTSRKQNRYLFDPQIFIAAEQSFDCSISYPSGLVPIIATVPITTDVPLKVGVTLSGVWLRPLQ